MFIGVLRDSALGAVDLADPERPVDGLTVGEIETSARMSRPAVTNLLRYFAPVLQAQDANGRPIDSTGRARRWTLNPEIGILVAAEVGDVGAGVRIADLFGRLLYEGTRDVGPLREDDEGPHTAHKILDWVAGEIRKGLDSRSPRDVVGVALSIAAPVDRREDRQRVRTGLALGSEPAVPSMWSEWQLTRVSDQLRRRLGWQVPFLLDNNASLGALAEAIWGAGRPKPFAQWSKYDNIIFVDWSRGIGAGLIIGGALYRGRGVAGELGHTVVAEGPQCPICGHHGCLETVASTEAIARMAGAQNFGAALEAAAVHREPIALDAFDRATAYLAQALGPAIHLLNPDLVIIGGEVGTRAHDLLKDNLSQRLRPITMPPAFGDAEIIGAELRNGSTALQGALGLILREEAPNALLEFLLQRQAEVATESARRRGATRS